MANGSVGAPGNHKLSLSVFSIGSKQVFLLNKDSEMKLVWEMLGVSTWVTCGAIVKLVLRLQEVG